MAAKKVVIKKEKDEARDRYDQFFEETFGNSKIKVEDEEFELKDLPTSNPEKSEIPSELWIPINPKRIRLEFRVRNQLELQRTKDLVDSIQGEYEPEPGSINYGIKISVPSTEIKNSAVSMEQATNVVNGVDVELLALTASSGKKTDCVDSVKMKKLKEPELPKKAKTSNAKQLPPSSYFQRPLPPLPTDEREKSDEMLELPSTSMTSNVNPPGGSLVLFEGVPYYMYNLTEVNTDLDASEPNPIRVKQFKQRYP